MALTGTYTRSLDEKRRLAVPKRLRDEFGEPGLESLYVAPGLDRSLALYAPAAFDLYAKKISEQPTNRADVRNYVRLFYARAEKVEFDAQGRIRIPDRLAELAGLERDVVLLGVHDHAEIWDGKLWDDFLNRHSPEFDAMASQAFES
jgi:MraZ protein